MQAWILVVALFLLSAGLRELRHPLGPPLGFLCFVAMVYQIGYALSGVHWVGGGVAAGWLGWEAWKVVAAVRRWRAPEKPEMAPRRAPNREHFPGLRELTEELEALGFEEVDEIGSEYQQVTRFFRVFFHAEERIQAIIAFHEESEFAFYYVSMTTRDESGEEWTTWNNPMPFSMLLPPGVHLHTVEEGALGELLEEHRAFFGASERQPGVEDDFREGINRELRRYIAYNIEQGVLERVPEEEAVRYSWRGVRMVLRQILRQVVRFS